jgi:nucleoside-diphosphate-sugar epimerase
VTTLIVGCGYLGERAASLLCKKGEQVVGTVRSRGRAAELLKLGIEPFIADVLDLASWRTLPEVEHVLYCVGFDRTAGATRRAVYVDGLQNVLDTLPGSVSRFVYASSTGVYGQTGAEWVDENSAAAPVHESGVLCLEAEDRVRGWALRRGKSASSIVLRFAGLYGPARVVRRSLVERGDAIPGDPAKFLNLIHIDDAAKAAVAALEARRADGVYLICDDRPVTRGEYYSLVAALLGAPEPRFEASQPASPHESRDTSNKRIANHRMKSGLGIVLEHSDITTGLPAALSEKGEKSHEKGATEEAQPHSRVVCDQSKGAGST